MASKETKPVDVAPITQDQLNERLSEWGWRLHATAMRWYPPIADGTPHLPDDEGKPQFNTTRFLHMSDLTTAIEHSQTAELIVLIEKWGVRS